MKYSQKSTILILLGSLGLFMSGCQNLEHRSEVPKKEPLPKLTAEKEKRKHLATVWTKSDSDGLGKGDARLKPATIGNSVVIADHKGHIFAYDKQSGSSLWKINTNTTISAGPAVSKDFVSVGTRNGEVLTYRMSNGSFLWRVSLSGEVLAAPTIGGDSIFVHALDGSVTALNLQDGRVQWRYNSHTPSIVLRQSSRPIVNDRHVIVGFANGKLRALNRNDGTVEWERDIGAPKGRSDVQRMADISSDPIISEGVVYAVSYQGRLAAISLENGSELWGRNISSNSGMALSKDVLYITEVWGLVRAVNKKTGETLWEQKGLKGRQLTTPVVMGSNLVVGDEEGYLHFLSQSNGSYVARDRVDNKGIEAAPVALENRLVVLGRSGKLAVLK